MFAIKFLVLFIAVSCESKASLMPQAILQLVQTYYGDSSTILEIAYSSKKVKILDETLKLLSAVKQLQLNPSYLYDTIYLFDTVENFYKHESNVPILTKFDANLKKLVYCEDANEKKILQFLQPDTYAIFLIENIDQISLHTITRITEKKCRANQLIKINRFSSLERKWKTDKFFMPRIENFYGCEFLINLADHNEIGMPFISAQEDENGPETAEGVLVDMLNVLSTHLNFTLFIGNEARKKAESLGLNPDASRSTYDFAIGTKILETKHGASSSASSDPIYSTSDIYVVPPGELYTSWEKLLMPFDRLTWMLLGITFAIAFLVILLIKASKSTSMYELVIGSNVTTPSLNVIAIFMGIGQILLPQRNTTRFFFINFILFSLIMRTAYQGKYFEFLTSDMRKKPVQTIKELKENGFSVVVNSLDDVPLRYFHELLYG